MWTYKKYGNIENMEKYQDCPLHITSAPVNPEHITYLLHDTQNIRQAISARVMRRLSVCIPRVIYGFNGYFKSYRKRPMQQY